MARRKRYKKQDPGPNPDPERYILVMTKEGNYYRRKRGLNKPALLNAAFQQNVDSIKVCSPAAKRMAIKLRDHLRGIDTGRLIARFAALLKKALNEKGVADFSFFGDYDFQQDHPLEDLLQVHYKYQEKDGFVELKIPIKKQGVKQYSGLVSGYYFDLVLLYGDPTKDDGLKAEFVTSQLYSYEISGETTCTLSLPLPEGQEPWMVMLKVSSLEGHELAHHPRHYAMKVIKQGS